MINISESRASRPSAGFTESARKKDEDNVEWISRNRTEDFSGTTLVLIGGRSGIHFRLRVAQSHVRHDLTPSHWSHVVLLSNSKRITTSTPVYEIALDPVGGFGYPPETNGVQKGKLGAYKDATAFPNIAVVQIPVELKTVNDALDRFQKQRAVLDAVELMLRWMSFVWGVGRSGNPLLEGYGIPSAAMLEVVIGAARYDLTPGLESRSSCPDVIWQAARWWHNYYSDQQGVEPPSGAWCTDQVLP